MVLLSVDKFSKYFKGSQISGDKCLPSTEAGEGGSRALSKQRCLHSFRNHSTPQYGSQFNPAHAEIILRLAICIQENHDVRPCEPCHVFLLATLWRWPDRESKSGSLQGPFASG